MLSEATSMTGRFALAAVGRAGAGLARKSRHSSISSR
jgi:hypothetical protein